MNTWFRFSTAVLLVAITATAVTQAQQDVPLEEDPSYNPDEDLKSFDLIMKPYKIPVQTTTYVDFAFNLPEDAPEAYHVVFGEVLNSQPSHLHHFVLTGCRNKVDEALVGLPIEDDSLERDCTVYIGQWAPGASVFGIADPDTGFLMGNGLGIQALLLNVHYTDGAYEADGVTQKVATDGIRVHYTPTFRPYSSTPKDLIGIGSGPRQLVVPPGESRFFVTRSCQIESNCKDQDPERLAQAVAVLGFGNAASNLLEGDVSCPSAVALCGLSSEIGYWARRLCPATCGYCDERTPEGAPNPRASNEYRITSIGYHAHLLGREMYATHVREAEAAVNVATTKDANTNLVTTPSSEAIVTDMESRDFWIFDFQEVIPLQSEVVQPDNTTLRGLGVKTGDKIQVTCVYDSTYRDEPTRFDVSTYDEMCITTAHLTFATPESLLNGTTAAASGVLELGLELELLSFSCAEDEASDVYTGRLAPGEDGRNIWRDHPIADAEGCTFPTSGVRAIWGTRNCGNNNSGGSDDSGDSDDDDDDTGRVCGSDLELVPETQAGASCEGGTYHDLDANLGTTEDQCTGGGGVWEPYTCAEADYVLTHEAEAYGLDEETVASLVADWFRPKCCVEPSGDSNFEGDSDSRTVPISAAPSSGSMGWALALITLANYVFFE